MAENALLADAKLELAASAKWGADAEIVVAHVLMDDTSSDNATAVWRINGDRAVAQFKNNDISPIVLIRIDGVWKIDVDAYVDFVGKQLPDSLRYMKDFTRVVERANKDLAQNHKFTGIDSFTKHLQTELDKLNAPVIK